MDKIFIRPWYLILLLLAGLAYQPMSSQAAGRSANPRLQAGHSVAGADRPVNLVLNPQPSSLRQDIPARLRERLHAIAAGEVANTTTFLIHYIPAGGTNSFGHPCAAFPAEAEAAFNFAAQIWASLMNSSIPVTIQACWDSSLSDWILGSSGGVSSYHDFAGVPRPGVLYQVALANALAGQDLNGAADDISIAYNANFANFYFGTDLNTPSNKINFATVVLHEIAHGLGLAGSMTVIGGQGSWGFYNCPLAFDTFTVDNQSHHLLDPGFYENYGMLGALLTSGPVFFDGPHTRAANGGQPAPLFIPSTWIQGSSYSHLSEAYNNTPNALMTYSINFGETDYNPGPVALGILQDLGWKLASDNPTATSTATAIPTSTPAPTPALIPTATVPGPQGGAPPTQVPNLQPRQYLPMTRR